MKTRFALKAATEDVHRTLDEQLSRLDLGNRQDYRRFLRFHALTVPSVEGTLEAAGLDALVDGWSNSRRAARIAVDLEKLGEPVPSPFPAPKIAGTAELLGTAYVLEGSRLGGRILRRQVGAGLPATFLSDEGSLGSWPALIAAMERRLCTETLLADAKSAARASFCWFLHVAREVGI